LRDCEIIPIKKPFVGAFGKFIEELFDDAILVGGPAELYEGLLGVDYEGGYSSSDTHIVAESPAREEHGDFRNINGATDSCDTFRNMSI
jgi:hypothetical protein